MKYLNEFRNGEIAQRMAREIWQVATRRWKIMEICGGQTHSIIRNGIDQMLPPGIEMDLEIAQRMAREIWQVATRRWKIMEICGGQTHSIIRNGIDQMLPPGIEMIH